MQYYTKKYCCSPQSRNTKTLDVLYVTELVVVVRRLSLLLLSHLSSAATIALIHECDCTSNSSIIIGDIIDNCVHS